MSNIEDCDEDIVFDEQDPGNDGKEPVVVYPQIRNQDSDSESNEVEEISGLEETGLKSANSSKRETKSAAKNQLKYKKNFAKQQRVLACPTQEFIQKRDSIVITEENCGLQGSLKTIKLNKF